MDRRVFIKGIGSTVGIMIPTFAIATSTDNLSYADLAGALFYTEAAPGRWSEKVAGHVPRIEQQSAANKQLKIKVVTGHEMKGYEHYIVKHILLDKKFKFLDEHLFDPSKESAPISEFELTQYSGTLYALSVCNQHDTWLNSIEI